MVYRNALRRRLVVICLLWDLDEFAKFVVHNDRRSKTSFSYIRPPAAHYWANKRWHKDTNYYGNGKEKNRKSLVSRTFPTVQVEINS